MRRALSGLIGAFALACCTSALEPELDFATRYVPPPRIGYKCDEIQEANGERLSITTDDPDPRLYALWHVEWRKQLADGVHLELTGYFKDGADSNFSDAVLEYTLYARFDSSRFGWYVERGKTQHPGLITEIGAGSRVIRTWAQSNVALALRPENVEFLGEARGDVTLKLYDANKVLQEATFSGDLIHRSIEQLRKMYAAANRRADDQEHLCESYEYDVVFLD